MAERASRSARRGAAAVAGGCLFAVACAAVGLSCSAKNTQKPALEVVVSTDLKFLTDYNFVEVRVTQQGADGTYPLIADKDVLRSILLPQVLTVEPGSSAYQGARITATALKDARIVVSTTAQVQVPTSQVLELDMFLGADCVNVSCPGAQSTCRDGACKSEVIDPTTLKSYDPTDVEAGPLFDGTLPTVDAGVDASSIDGGKDGTSPADAHGDVGSTGPSDSSTPDVHADAPKEAAATCGAAGGMCCQFHQCNAGCCVYGTCVAQQAVCMGLGSGLPPPNCTNASCGNCGGPNQPCCPGNMGNTCTAPFTVCQSAMCNPCGMTGQQCCPGSICTPGNACQANGGDAGGGTCVMCGGSGQLCCDVTSTVQGAPTTPCIPNSGLTCGSSGTCL
jgi:hypothetical protein